MIFLTLYGKRNAGTEGVMRFSVTGLHGVLRRPLTAALFVSSKDARRPGWKCVCNAKVGKNAECQLLCYIKIAECRLESGQMSRV